MKRCTKCNVEKDESEFYKDSRKTTGLYSHCKMCFLAHTTERRRTNREKFLVKEAAYRDANRETIRARASEWRKVNPDRYKEQVNKARKRFVSNNPEKVAAIEVRYRMKLTLGFSPPEELVATKTLFVLINRQIKEMTK